MSNLKKVTALAFDCQMKALSNMLGDSSSTSEPAANKVDMNDNQDQATPQVQDTPTDTQIPVEDMSFTLDLRLNEQEYNHGHTATTIVESDGTSQNIKLRVSDSNAKVIHQDTITTDEFGTATTMFDDPKYYIRDEPITVTASYENEPTRKIDVSSTIKLTKTKLTITTDKSEYTDAEKIIVSAATDPPVSTLIELDGIGISAFNSKFKITTGSDGKGEQVVKVFQPALRVGKTQTITIEPDNADAFDYTPMTIIIHGK